ncbi:hypothetical protein XBKB1_1060026 [Xenorhabdus bovienii str. kraussei Becker Underwood]|uniref:Uncharacterized protein n=1 Tax=Xenorhabdus bovienii str. kraussei Becker Underwood TaxID=1398204 RepID=A0A077PQX2_XENBV|nr:hypothetical protein XBKB1_1060026 [Xenorhabdus bovienii str. kraussei Becker Underwood]
MNSKEQRQLYPTEKIAENRINRLINVYIVIVIWWKMRSPELNIFVQ